MRIGELARRSDTSIDTIRYYEKAGLLPPPPRGRNGYRDYATTHLERLAFVRHCRELDMSLEDIRRLLAFVEHPEADCAAVDRLIDDQLARVRERVAKLSALERQLLALRAQCGAGTTAGECGILRELVAAAQDDDCVCHREGHGDSAAPGPPGGRRRG